MFELPEPQTLPNGLKLDYSDVTERYYGDYYHVCIKVKCALPHEEHAHWHLFKKLERAGVNSAKLDDAKQDLLDGFTRLILPYLQRGDFPERFTEAKRKKRLQVS
ncbi:MAG: hypothetical protein ABR516_04540 [Desulfuromonadaceae bacterium]|nr:hypothetical protein [Geobacteraceae bacterium]